MDSVASPAPSPFAIGAPDVLQTGFHPIMIGPGVKKPQNFDPRSGAFYDAAGWTHHADRLPTPGTIDRWSRAPGAGIGIALGSPAGDGLFVTAIDIDVTDAGKVATLRAALPQSPMVKTGAKGLTAFYRSPPEIASAAYNIGAERAVDLLAKGKQTVLPPSVHPEGMSYRWIDGTAPVPVDQLPIFGTAERDALEAALAGLGWQSATHAAPDTATAAGGATEPRQGTGDAAGDYFRSVNDAALANLDAWVPALDLPRWRRKSGGYEAVAAWRQSSTGRPLEQRKRNLSIVTQGIADFGGDSYTPIDLAVAALPSTVSEAATWLADRLGITAAEEAAFDAMFDTESILANGAAKAAAKVAAVGAIEVETIAAKHASAITWDDREGNRAQAVGWLVKKLLPDRGTSILFGQSGAGKSFMALELAACVISGQPFFGHRVKAPGGVLFALGEAGGTMPDRLEALRRGRFSGEAPSDPVAGGTLDFDKLPVAWTPVANLAHPAPWQAFANHVRSVADEMETRHGRKLRLVIVDTIVASFGFADDPDAAAATKAMKAMDDLAQELGLLFLPVHHSGKSKAAGEHGSYAWRGSAETSLEVDAKRTEANGEVEERRIFLKKNRHAGNEGWNQPFELKEIDLGIDEDGDAITSAIVVPFKPGEGANDNARADFGRASGFDYLFPKPAVRKFLSAFELVYEHTAFPHEIDGKQVWVCRKSEVQVEYLKQNDGKGAKRANVERYFRDAAKAAVEAHEVYEGEGLLWPIIDFKRLTTPEKRNASAAH